MQLLCSIIWNHPTKHFQLVNNSWRGMDTNHWTLLFLYKITPCSRKRSSWRTKAQTWKCLRTDSPNAGPKLAAGVCSRPNRNLASPPKAKNAWVAHSETWESDGSWEHIKIRQVAQAWSSYRKKKGKKIRKLMYGVSKLFHQQIILSTMATPPLYQPLFIHIFLGLITSETQSDWHQYFNLGLTWHIQGV